ncbi:endonuclease V [Candidatus Woesearchaeota archaeon]|nr:endonuclease V [Candidatus Woesearchaeota archaeon]
MNVDVEKMRKEQLKLSKEIVLRDEFDKLKLIAGCDCIFENERVIATIIVLEYPSMKFVEAKYAIQEDAIPYIPGYLAYREMPAITVAYAKLKNKPDIVICDGNGILHPRRIGSASHLGIALNTPTIGVAKKLLLGHVQEGKVWVDNEIRGFEVKTKEVSNPIYVSPGHNVSLGTALKLAMECTRPPHKLPEPLHAAHKYANKVRKNRPKENSQRTEQVAVEA